MFFFYTLWKLWFSMFSGGIKKTNLMKCVKKRLLCVDNFWSVKPFWILSVRKFACRNFFDSLKIFVCGKLRWSSKNFFAENFLVCGKFPWLWKISMTVERFLDCGKFPWWSKNYFLDCRKNNRSNNFEKNATIETIKTKYYVQSITYAQILNL